MNQNRKPLKRTNKDVRAVINFLLEKKARDIIVLDVRKISSITDFIFVASGSSDRHLNTIADNLFFFFVYIFIFRLGKKKFGHSVCVFPFLFFYKNIF